MHLYVWKEIVKMSIGWVPDMIGWACAQPFPTLATPLLGSGFCIQESTTSIDLTKNLMKLLQKNYLKGRILKNIHIPIYVPPHAECR